MKHKKMKQTIIVGALVALSATNVMAAVSTDIYVKGNLIQTDVEPEIMNGTTFVPISFIAKELGASVKWESPNVLITKDGVNLTIRVGTTQAVLHDGRVVPTGDEKSYIIEGRVMVPLRFISEQFDCKVGYEALAGQNKKITIDPINLSQPTRYDTTADGEWGIGEQWNALSQTTTLFLKNMTTGEVEELYVCYGQTVCNWLNNTKMVIATGRGTSNLGLGIQGQSTDTLYVYDVMANALTPLDSPTEYYIDRNEDCVVYSDRAMQIKYTYEDLQKELDMTKLLNSKEDLITHINNESLSEKEVLAIVMSTLDPADRENVVVGLANGETYSNYDMVATYYKKYNVKTDQITDITEDEFNKYANAALENVAPPNA